MTKTQANAASNNQGEAEPKSIASESKAAASTTAETQSVVNAPLSFDTWKASIAETIAAKVTLREEAKTLLSEAASTCKEGETFTAIGRDIASKAAYKLYQGQSQSLFTKQEVSSLLGEQFGFKVKADGTASKTPNGEGEATRKRVVRAVLAAGYIAGDDVKYFEGCDKTAIAEVLHKMDTGSISVWSAYDYLGQIVADNRETIPLALSPSKLLKFVEDLAKPSNIDKINASNELRVCYFDVMSAIAAIVGIDLAKAA